MQRRKESTKYKCVRFQCTVGLMQHHFLLLRHEMGKLNIYYLTLTFLAPCTLSSWISHFLNYLTTLEPIYISC